MSFRWMSASVRPRSSRARSANVRRREALNRSDLTIDFLEDRTLLNATDFRPTFQIAKDANGITFNGSPGPIGYTPTQVRKAYGIDQIMFGNIVGNGAGQTIAIIDAYDWSTATSDLHAFDQQYGLPDPPSFTKVNENGQASPLPPSDVKGGWGVEEALDVEWAHSIAPMANIILVEANAPTALDLIQTAVPTAAALPGVSAVSMSFGSGEFSQETTFDSVFTTPTGHDGVTFLASTGDSGAPGEYPAYSPNVVAVGGTTLNLNSDNSYNSESAWSGSGGGISQVEPTPSYQTSLGFANRTIPDVAFDADPNTGVSVYDSYDFGAATPWDQVGGTSLSCPSWAGLTAIINQARVAGGYTVQDGPSETLPMLYALPSTDFHDITTGNNINSQGNGFSAGTGYDLVTGLGTPIAPNVVMDFIPNRIVVTGAASVSAVELTSFTSQVATFSDQLGLAASNQYSASIDWGDGSTSAGVIVAGSTSDAVNGTHTFATPGSYTITITVTQTSKSRVGTGTSTATVTGAPLNGTPNSFSIEEGQTYTGSVGTFTTINHTAPADRFSASIEYGDGNVSTGTIVSKGNGLFEIDGSNTYQRFGNYTFTVTITDSLGGNSVFTGTATVTAAPISSTGKTFSTIEGTQFDTTVATITSQAPNPVASDFSATINWGDGSAITTTSNGASIVDQGGRFDVKAPHNYARFGTYTILINIQNTGGSTTSTSSTVTVSDAPISSSPIRETVEQGQTATGVIATILDSNILGVASDLSATINWGDGTSLATGTINTVNANNFSVNGSHQYLVGGTYNVVVNILSRGGQTTSTQSTIVVTNAPVTATGTKITSPAGVTFTNQVATFVDGFSAANLSDFTATIDWGDSSPVDTGVVTQPGGVGTPFIVTGTHGYVYPNTYSATITISEAGTQVATTTTQVVQTPSPIVVAGTPLNPITIDQSFTGNLATFTTANLLAPSSFYLASINWGDGTSGTGTVTNNGAGSFIVSTSTPHAFPSIQNYTITVTVLALSGDSANATTSLQVNDAPITATASPEIQTFAGTTFNALLGTFTQYAAAPTSNFVAAVNWGDNTTSTATVGQLTDGTFTVTGNHVYAINGVYPIHVEIQSLGGSTGSIDTSARVEDVPLTVQTGAIVTVQNQLFSNEVATFTTPNLLTTSGEYTATVNWGDGTPTQGSAYLGGPAVPTDVTVVGSNGSFQVIASHTYANAPETYAVTVIVYHHSQPVLFIPVARSQSSQIKARALSEPADTSSGSVGSARVLLPVSGSLSPASDSGYSNTDGITNINQPVFNGAANPGATIKLFANTAAALGGTLVGQGTVDASGHWSIQVNTPLSDGQYYFNAQMIDTPTGNLIEDASLAATPSNQSLVIGTAGPTVQGVVLNPATGVLQITFHDAVGMNPNDVGNPANYTFSKVGRRGTQTLAERGIGLSGDSINSTVNLAYSLSAGRGRGSASYVIDIHALGITDLAGNTLVEKTLVAFPQVTNSPNPDYIAQISVNGGVASAPTPYVSLAEQIAAGQYSAQAQRNRVIRVPHPRMGAVHFRRHR